MPMGMFLQSLSISQFERFIDFLFDGNVKKLKEAGIIRYPEKINDRETIKTAQLDDYVKLSDGLVYFTYVKEIGTFYYSPEYRGY